MKKVDLLEAFIEGLCQRLFTVKVIGKDNEIVKEHDRLIDAIKAELEKEL